MGICKQVLIVFRSNDRGPKRARLSLTVISHQSLLSFIKSCNNTISPAVRVTPFPYFVWSRSQVLISYTGSLSFQDMKLSSFVYPLFVSDIFPIKSTILNLFSTAVFSLLTICWFVCTELIIDKLVNDRLPALKIRHLRAQLVNLYFLCIRPPAWDFEWCMNFRKAATAPYPQPAESGIGEGSE